MYKKLLRTYNIKEQYEQIESVFIRYLEKRAYTYKKKNIAILPISAVIQVFYIDPTGNRTRDISKKSPFL